jgi:GDP-mannose 6-dehydrogenase
LGVSAKKIHEMFVADTKLNISPRYLVPGGAFGGSCLPKDLRALQYIASDIGANTSIIDSVVRSNDAHKHFLFQYCLHNLSPPAHVLLLGLAFKSQTDDLRESPGVDLARKLLNAGFRLSVYDPTVDEAKLVGQNLGYAVVHLPKLSSILVPKCQLKHTHFDLVIDAVGIADQLNFSASRVVSIDALP